MCAKVIRIQETLDNEAGGGFSNEEMSLDPMTPTEKIRGPNFDTGLNNTKEELGPFDYFKYAWSTGASVGAMVIVCYGISIESYVFPVPAVAAYIIAIIMLTNLFYLEGLMIAIAGTQFWDREVFKEVYPRAYQVHELLGRPDNVKRFIIGRQFFTVLTNFVLAQIFTFASWNPGNYDPILFFIVVKSGLVGVLIILAWAQLMPELLAAEYPLRFMNMRGSSAVCYACLFFDAMGVGK